MTDQIHVLFSEEGEPETVEIKPPPIDVGMKPARVASASDLLAIEAAKNKRARKQIKRKGPDHD
jgi:hypothetical protein